jgi:hypothetical protein
VPSSDVDPHTNPSMFVKKELDSCSKSMYVVIDMRTQQSTEKNLTLYFRRSNTLAPPQNSFSLCIQTSGWLTLLRTDEAI